jgi:hypothetical protein
VVGLDRDHTLYACTNPDSGPSTCFATQSGKKDPLWSLELDGSQKMVGAALLPGRMLVATQGGLLYALQDTP